MGLFALIEFYRLTMPEEGCQICLESPHLSKSGCKDRKYVKESVFLANF